MKLSKLKVRSTFETILVPRKSVQNQVFISVIELALTKKTLYMMYFFTKTTQRYNMSVIS